MRAQHTGMVSTQDDRCAGGFRLKEPFRSRGYIARSITPKATKVAMIVLTGARDHTKEGTHPGTTLVQLKRQHPHLSKMVGAGDTIVVYKEPAPFFGC